MKPSVIVSCGDVNGVGLECFVKALQLGIADCTLKLAVNIDALRHYILQADVEAVVENDVMHVGDVLVQLINIEHMPEVEPGVVSKAAGMHAVESLNVAISLALTKQADVMLTLPISKEACKLAGWMYPGQTEMLAEADGNSGLMVLCQHKTRIALVTGHVPLNSVTAFITPDRLKAIMIRFAETLHRDFEIGVPKISVLGLNPHAGDNGHIGNEDVDIIGQTISSTNLLSENHPSTHWVFEGPFAADGFFAFDSYREYDGIIAMYHDQGLIPIKLLSHGAGVNYTAGLSFVRTSPDHGTAFSIAGKSLARPSSTLQALKLGIEIFRARASAG